MIESALDGVLNVLAIVLSASFAVVIFMALAVAIKRLVRYFKEV